MTSDFLVTAVQMAFRLKVKPRTVVKWAKQGRIPAVRVGPKVLRFDPVEVIAALKSSKEREPVGE